MNFLRILRRRALPFCVVVGAIVVLVGCRTSRRAESVDHPYYRETRVDDCAAPTGTYLPVERATADSLASALGMCQCAPAKHPAGAPIVPVCPARPINVLTLSGGGQYGAFAGGALVGWTSLGTRPDFDVVTGISSGALIATYAYLGPNYDDRLQRMLTNLKTEQVFKYRPVIGIFRDKSLASSAPLAKLIETEVNKEFLDAMRVAHQSGRRLFVGTMNMYTRRLVIWDLGAIATSGRPDADDLVRKILLATSSIPGLVPPVEFDVVVDGVRYREYHVDGGAVAQTFVRFGPEIAGPDSARAGNKWLQGSNLYVIAGGKLYADRVTKPLGFLGRTTSTVSASLYALYRADLWRLYALCASSGMSYQHGSVPLECKIAPKSTEFDMKAMRELFSLGYDMVREGRLWRMTPPGTEPGEEEFPRAGFQFTIPRCESCVPSPSK